MARKLSDLVTPSPDKTVDTTVHESEAFLPPDTQLEDITMDNRNSFEKTLVFTTKEDREQASQEAMLISDKNKQKNVSVRI